ncbi:MAG: nuclear transport factor 2 family protein [Terriglobales bacterium]
MYDKPKITAWANATGAEQFERLMWQEIKAANVAEVEKRLAPTFVVVSPGGVRDRAAEMDLLRRFTVKEYSLGELEVRPNGNDMVVTYSLTLDATLDGQPVPTGPWRVMTVWQQVGTTWVAIAQSYARAEPASGSLAPGDSTGSEVPKM